MIERVTGFLQSCQLHMVISEGALPDTETDSCLKQLSYKCIRVALVVNGDLMLEECNIYAVTNLAQ